VSGSKKSEPLLVDDATTDAFIPIVKAMKEGSGVAFMSVFMGEVDEQCECIRDHASEKSD
jgi:hypothetical protein